MNLARIVGVLVLLAALSVRAGGDEDPSTTVVQLHEALVENMRDGEALGFAGRLERIRPRVTSSFQFDSIARAVLGRHWPTLPEADRAQMRSLLERLTAVNYASRFDRFAGEAFVITGVEAVRGGRQLVRSELRDGATSKASFDYVLERADGGWRIVNVIANGVSDLSLKRAEYASVIRKDGFRSLLMRIGQQITDLMEQAASSG